MTSLSELSKPVAWKLHHHDRYYFEENADVVAIAESVGKAKGDAVYSQEYVSALLAELEAKDSEIDAANARVDVMCAKAMNLTERAEVAEQKLATPVRLPEPDVNDYGYESIGYRAVLSALSDAGVTFTVEGDE
ncbi:hypothetical protein [Serratia entomophila]|uniref:hypothetical protein n=1 Tax=Serratia entomophila TaxID=42906 RepID=UPI002178DDA3|nr:hypothetical protein [Serratia entomophila]CAI0825251.1 Uncharacterised protein [Serratia entomophila]CAI0846124.1 Uncharacterised protein [Serratia entomophila]CAI0876048.1 Uncharacterised protein [Serratia entomophila]